MNRQHLFRLFDPPHGGADVVLLLHAVRKPPPPPVGRAVLAEVKQQRGPAHGVEELGVAEECATVTAPPMDAHDGDFGGGGVVLGGDPPAAEGVGA